MPSPSRAGPDIAKAAKHQNRAMRELRLREILEPDVVPNDALPGEPVA